MNDIVKDFNYNTAGSYIVNQGNVGSDAVPFGRISAPIKKQATEVSYPAGSIMGKITATGEWTPVDVDASDGSEVAQGILFDKVVVADDTNTDTVTAPIDTGDMVVHSAFLSLTASVTTAQLDAIKLAMETAGFTFRNWDENEFVTT